MNCKRIFMDIKKRKLLLKTHYSEKFESLLVL